MGGTLPRKQEKTMNKRAIALFALAFVTTSYHSQALSQSRCNLTETTSPSIRGLRLGMTTQEVLAVFPGSAKRWERERGVKEAREKALKPDSSGLLALTFEPSDAAAGQFANVDSISAFLYKDRLADFALQYGGVGWNNVDEWLAKVSETLRLPGPQEWVVGSSEAPNKVLKCSGIEIEAAIQGGSASIRIRNTEYLKEINERSNSMDEKKRRELKP
jgi:hypothetical protein